MAETHSRSSRGRRCQRRSRLPEEQDWQRWAEPVLSTTNTTQDWSRVMLYMPRVIRADGLYKMWYVATSGPPRPANCSLGYATSLDGIHWEEYPGNPIVTDQDLQDAGGWGWCFQSPFVLYDLEERKFRMWFSALTHWEQTDDGELVEMTQQVGYAESPDGIAWDIHPEPVTRSGRCASVMQEADGSFTMWANARPARRSRSQFDLRPHHALALVATAFTGKKSPTSFSRKASTNRASIPTSCATDRATSCGTAATASHCATTWTSPALNWTTPTATGSTLRPPGRQTAWPGPTGPGSPSSRRTKTRTPSTPATRPRPTCSSCRAATCSTTPPATCWKAGCRPTARRARDEASRTATSATLRLEAGGAYRSNAQLCMVA